MVVRNKMIDIHSHILPGIDDGAKTIVNSIDILRELSGQGVTDIIATPHYMPETKFMSPRAENVKLLAKLKEELAVQKIDINVYLGNEIYINDHIAGLIESGQMSTLADSNYLLVELPINNKYPNYADYLIDLINSGYKVVLAHPERYSIVQKDFEIVKDLYDSGVLLQCNMGSIVGQYGRSAKKTIRKLAKEKMIFALGSDAHRCRGNNYILKAQKKLRKYYNRRELKQILIDNPSKILHG